MQEQSGHKKHRPELATPMGTDPVCGMKVSLASPHRHVANGSEAVFCSARCHDRFAADPWQLWHGDARRDRVGRRRRESLYAKDEMNRL